jgi:hypothetical protein
MLEMSCSDERSNEDSADPVSYQPWNMVAARRRIREVLSSDEFLLAIPAEPQYSNRARILSGVNDGKRMTLFGGKFAYLRVDVDRDRYAEFSISVRIFARASIRAERNTSTYSGHPLQRDLSAGVGKAAPSAGRPLRERPYLWGAFAMAGA